jgi:hypothetical protein
MPLACVCGECVEGREVFVGRVLLGIGLTASFLIAQGVFILKTGRLFGRSGDRAGSATRLTARMRVFYATLYIGSGGAAAAVLATVAVKHHLTVATVMDGLRGVFVDLLFALSFIGVGIWSIVYPSGLLGWARRAHPDATENSPAALVIARVVGAGLCAMGVVLLFAVVA